MAPLRPAGPPGHVPGAPVVLVDRLAKDYGRRRAVDAISFSVQEREVFALLGPNGAGKSSTLEILTGHRRRTSGQVHVLGLDPWKDGRALRGRVGVALQSAGIDADLSVGETLRLYAGLYRRHRPVDELLEVLSLTAVAQQRVGALSGGQQRRLDLALALVGEPALVVLDEPTTGLDPVSRHEAWAVIRQLREEGRTVLLSSHYMDEVQALADRIAVLAHGRIVAEATPATLAGRDLAAATIAFQLPRAGWESTLEAQQVDVERRDSTVVIRCAHPTQVLASLTSWAAQREEELLGLTVTRPSLEEAYLALTERREVP